MNAVHAKEAIRHKWLTAMCTFVLPTSYEMGTWSLRSSELLRTKAWGGVSKLWRTCVVTASTATHFLPDIKLSGLPHLESVWMLLLFK